MEQAALKSDLHTYLQRARDVVVWKVDGLSKYDVRRPLVPSGTNLLGLVKHLASVESSYLGFVVGRPFPEPRPWTEDESDPDADMWVTADESREWVVDLYRRVWAHSDATITALDLDALGHVPWWPADRAHPPLHRILLHLIAETHRHAGQVDILREQLDNDIGYSAKDNNLPTEDPAYWSARFARLEAVAQTFR